MESLAGLLRPAIVGRRLLQQIFVEDLALNFMPGIEPDALHFRILIVDDRHQRPAGIELDGFPHAKLWHVASPTGLSPTATHVWVVRSTFFSTAAATRSADRER